MASGYIDDGYNRNGYISAAQEAATGDRQWEALEFTYRVASRVDNIEFDARYASATANEKIDPKCAVAGEKLYCEYVASRIQSWSLKDRGGHAVPITAQAAGRIVASLFTRMYLMIRGVDFGDPKPPVETVTTDEEQLKN